ncbi:hypothetical protein IQ06DRAFT_25117 [Phaeosphaeriaceae sp. SRC1lsM3a]|nr:hypothetical protein IQ06DRAFT_25117 [Stagonospora sp. SRC1lsM3a]
MATSTSADAALNRDLDQFMTETGNSPSPPRDEQEQADEAPNRKRKKAQDDSAVKKSKVQENRAIYITNLPRDTNEVEIHEVFKKYGMIDQGADGNRRIKMYTDEKGDFNGEALVVYFKPASITLAIQMMDDYYFRIEEQNNGTIGVKEADFSYKRNKDSDQIVSKMSRKDKKASERNRADLLRKLNEWSDNEDEVQEAFAPKKNKWAKVCIVKYAFTLEELDEDPAALLEIKEDMRDEAEKFGKDPKVTLYDKEADGIVTVAFKEFEEAENFRDACNGRNYAKRKLAITIAEDRVKFKKSARTEEPDSSDEERLEKALQ